ncbi:3654_t:CDS:2 [Acaulospora colombiana]|uniref:3654_t:CDS:1 n=1 Tax=Acaulospora colombiana TaxID=27376 RepID=A0ACA9K9E9_9GLOM|nr:3654_t:CDS:2 [Acaulospora colombiana]
MTSYRKRNVNDFDNESNNIPDDTVFISKRQKIKSSLHHPLGIKPWGNYYVDLLDAGSQNSCRDTCLGILARLNDELILEVLGQLSAKDLLSLSSTSKILYCFATFDELWKQMVIQKYNGDWWWQGTWRLTFLKRSDPEYNVNTGHALCMDNFYSDTLYQPFLYGSMRIEQFTSVENIDRCKNLSLDDFINRYAKTNLPVIITDVVTKWPAFGKWSMEYLVEKYGEILFRAEAIDIKLKNYARYSADTTEESPLYLFDKNFGNYCEGILEDFSVPDYFSEDFFRVLGSTFHKDPNSTSAWNAVITGSKKWIMYPPNTLPPGVFVSPDEAEVTAPVSLMEWYLNYYKGARKSDPRPLEGICRAGEIIFVPNGWWHMVVNLEDSIAITQNFVGSYNLPNVLRFLRDKPDQISGFSSKAWPNREDIYNVFCEKFRESYPNVLDELGLVKPGGHESSMWDKIKCDEGNEFIFGF